MPTTNTNTSTNRPYYDKILEDAGLSPVTAEELQSRFDAVTQAEYDRQRTDLQNATNQYYNQLYTTQNTAMDTIRQANAQAVATGASKGVQAANELSAILGLQSESATGAAELANQATILAQDETTAMLENILNAETQAAEQNQAIANALIQAGSVDVEAQNADTAAQQVLMNYWTQYMQALANEDSATANAILNEMINYDKKINPTNTENTSNTGSSTDSMLNLKAQNTATPTVRFLGTDYVSSDTAATKVNTLQTELAKYAEELGVTDKINVQEDVKQIQKYINENIELYEYSVGRGEYASEYSPASVELRKKYNLPSGGGTAARVAAQRQQRDINKDIDAIISKYQSLVTE